MTFIHFADLHYSQANADRALKSLEAILRHARDLEDFRAFIFCGDWFDGPLQAISKTGYSDMLGMVVALLHLGDIYCVSGTVVHDKPGCYEPMARLQAPHQWIMVDPREKYLVKSNGRGNYTPDALILGMSEPRAAKLALLEEGRPDQVVLEQLFQGVGVKRREHPDLPCIFMFHGHVEGAQLRKDDEFRLKETRYPKALLELVGADYYALGDIHLAQELPGQAMRYAGSAFPVNWGELDLKTFTVVRVTEGRFSYEDVSCGHRPRQKVVWEASEAAMLSLDNATTHDTWLHVVGTELEVATLGQPKMLGNSRYTTEVRKPESVRAEGLADQQDLIGKATFYAADSGDDQFFAGDGCPLGIIDKCATLEGAWREQHGAPRSWRIDSLALEGAIGITDGQQKEKIVLDFDDVAPGVVALIGPSGSGKTTVVENMVPWARLLTRRGALSHHFEGTWRRRIMFTDMASFQRYEARIGSDGTFLYLHDGMGEPTVLAERAAEYEEEITKLFGSFDLYLRSVFLPQDPPYNFPKLSQAPTKARKEMMVQLCGLSRYEAYTAAAKTQADTTEGTMGTLLEQRSQLTARVDELGDVQRKAEANAAEYGAATAAASTADAELEATAVKERELAFRAQAHEETEKRCAELTREQEQLNIAIDGVERERKILKQRVQNVGDAKQTIAQCEEIEREIAESERELQSRLRQNEEMGFRHRNAVQAATQKRGEYDLLIGELAVKEPGVRADIERSRERFNEAQEWLDNFDEVHCPECGAILPEERRTTNAQRLENRKQDVAEYARRTTEGGEELRKIREKTQWLTAVQRAIGDPVAEEWVDLEPVTEGLATYRAQLNAYNYEGAREIVTANEEAAGREHQLAGQGQQLDVTLRKITGEMFHARNELDPHSVGNWLGAQEKLDTARAVYQEAATQKGVLELRANELAEQLKRQAKLLEQLDAIRTQLGDSERELAEWRFLERACGPKGLQALELSAAGPTVAATANQLLTAAYGDRFRVDFETQRLSSDGKRMIEDYLIWVTDKERGRRKLLENLSGGEEQWVTRALMDAFADIRAKGEGIRFETVFSDEADNNLDAEQSKAFIAMIEAGHTLLGRRHTVLITHNVDVQERIANQIRMEELSG